MQFYGKSNRRKVTLLLHYYYGSATLSYQRCSLYMCQVLQQALSVVDGGVQLRTGVLPLAIQVFST